MSELKSKFLSVVLPQSLKRELDANRTSIRTILEVNAAVVSVELSYLDDLQYSTRAHDLVPTRHVGKFQYCVGGS